MPHSQEKAIISQEKSKEIDFEKLAEQMKSWIFKNPEDLGALASLVEKLGDKVDEYDTILSDEASGRLPSLFLRKIINLLRKENDQEPVKIYFLAAGRHFDTDDVGNYHRTDNPKLDEFISKKADGLGKSLVVTEFIDTGGSIIKLMGDLDRNGVNYDVATISMRHALGEGQYGSNLEKRLIYGQIGDAGLKLYEKEKFSGVTKNRGSYSKSAHPRKSRCGVAQAMKDAREDIGVLAKELLPLLRNEKHNIS